MFNYEATNFFFLCFNSLFIFTFFSLTKIDEILITLKIMQRSKKNNRPKPALKQILKNDGIMYFNNSNIYFEISADGMQNTVISANGFKTNPPTFVFLKIKRQFNIVVIVIQLPSPYPSDVIPTYFGRNKIDSISATEPTS